MADVLTDLGCVANYVLNIALAVNVRRGIRCHIGQLRKFRYFKWEALTVNDVPVKSVKLEKYSTIENFGKQRNLPSPQLIASKLLFISETG